MSLCRLMIMDFEHQIGRFDELNNERYSNRDIKFGISYAQDLIKENYKYEPFLKFNLKDFIKWANKLL